MSGYTSRLPVLVGCVAIAATVVAGCTAGSGGATISSTGAASSSGRATLPTTISANGPILNIRDGYELFARSAASVARIELARGRVTVKPAPGIQSGAGAYFIAGSHAVVARAWDYVPGFLLPDDGPAQELPGALAGGGGQTLPGPGADQVWIEETTNGAESGVWKLHLVALDGRQTATSLRVDGPPLGPDGSGYILVSGSDGIYDVRPEGRKLVFPGKGDIVAAGPTGWLIHPCSGDADCDDVYVDRANGSQHTVHVHIQSNQPGVISPDASHAAVVASNIDNDGRNDLHLVDLATGADRIVDLPAGSMFKGPSRGAAMAWSPDSRWLFAAAAHILAVDMATGHARTLPDLPKDLQFFQVAIRSGP